MALNLVASIPDHVFLKMASYLRADELVKLEIAIDIDRFQLAFDNIRHFNIRVDLREGHEDYDTTYCRDLLLRCGSRLTSFKFWHSHLGDITNQLLDYSQEFADKLGRKCPNISEFNQDIWFSSDDFIKMYLSALELPPKITKITLHERNMSGSTHLRDMVKFVNTCHELYSLTFFVEDDNDNLTKSMVKFDNYDGIKNVYFEDRNNYSIENLKFPIEVIQKCPIIEKVEFYFGNQQIDQKLGEDEFRKLARVINRLPRFREITIRFKKSMNYHIRKVKELFIEKFDDTIDSDRFKTTKRSDDFFKWQRV